MTTPIAAQYQGPHHILRGLVRDHLMPADSPNLCADYPEVFARVIDVTVIPGGNVRKKLADDLIGQAKAVCAECPVRLTCLATNGRDYALGVVGGLTDAERAALFGGAA